MLYLITFIVGVYCGLIAMALLSVNRCHECEQQEKRRWVA